MGLVHDQRPLDTAWPPLYSSSLFTLVSRRRGVGAKLIFPAPVEARGRMELQGVWVWGWPEQSSGGGANGNKRVTCMDEFRGNISQIFPKSQDPSQSTQQPPQPNTRDTNFAQTRQALVEGTDRDDIQARPCVLRQAQAPKKQQGCGRVI